jgi:hypothetical protein
VVPESGNEEEAATLPPQAKHARLPVTKSTRTLDPAVLMPATLPLGALASKAVAA